MTNIKYSYNKLWKLMNEKRMLKKKLVEKTGISKVTIAKMARGEAVSLKTLAKIAIVLNVDIGDIVEIDRQLMCLEE